MWGYCPIAMLAMVAAGHQNGYYFKLLNDTIILQQESPPAWTQEAYRPPCSEYSFCCPTWVPPPAGYPPHPDLAGGYPVRYPPGGVPSQVPPGGVTQSGTPPGVPGQVPQVPGQVPTPQGVVPSQVPPGGVVVPGQVPPRPGCPPILTWLGGYLTGYLPPGQGTPLPPCGQTNTCENSTFPSYYVRGR